MGDSGVTESFLADLETNGRIEYNSTIGRIFISTALLLKFFFKFSILSAFQNSKISIPFVSKLTKTLFSFILLFSKS